MELAGFPKLEVTPVFTANAPNITQDFESGIGSWTDAQIVTLIREGRRPEEDVHPVEVDLPRGDAGVPHRLAERARIERPLLH